MTLTLARKPDAAELAAPVERPRRAQILARLSEVAAKIAKVTNGAVREAGR